MKHYLIAMLRRALTYLEPPQVPLVWEHHTFRRGHIELSAGVYGRGTITELALVCLQLCNEVDHITISVSNQFTVLVRTLGDRFTAPEIAEIARYKPAGILLEFREAGETYGRCAWDFENDRGAAVMLENKS